MLVYLVTNKVNGKKYIGYTLNSLEERKKTHIYKSRCKSNKHYHYLFSNALRKYGEENFTWEVLCTCASKEECCEKEIFYIKKYNTMSPNGYNLTQGGDGGIQSEETKAKISCSVKKYWEENKDSHPWLEFSHEKRSDMSKKAWDTKRKNGYVPVRGFSRSEDSKLKMSSTKNEKNKLKWFNIITKETVELSLTKMAEYTGLSTGTFNHLKQGRVMRTKCGWTYEQGRN